MADAKKLFQEAAEAYKAKDKNKARELLLQVTELDERNAKAWLLLSAVVDTLDDQLTALENVLALEPNNDKARKGLEVVKKKMAERGIQPSASSALPTSKPAPPSPSLANDPGWAAFLTGAEGSDKTPAASAPKSDPFGGLDFGGSDPWQTSSNPNDPALGSGSWDVFLKDSDISSSNVFGTSTPTPSTPPATSVEWGRDTNATPPPAATQAPNQYDDWIKNLGLEGQKNNDPFGGAANSDGLGEGWSDLASSDPFGSGVTPLGEGWGDLAAPTASDPFGGGTSGEFPAEWNFGDSSGANNAPSSLGDGWDAFQVEADTFGAAGQSSGASVLGEGWSDFAEDEPDPFGVTAKADPFTKSSSNAPFSVSPMPEPFAADSLLDEPGDDSFLKQYSKVDDSNPFEDSFLSELNVGTANQGLLADLQQTVSQKTKAKPSAKAKSAKPKNLAKYKEFFEQIPDEIPPVEASSNGGGAGVVITTLILFLLNLAAVAGLVMQIMG